MDSHDAKIASSVLAADGQSAPPRRPATQLKARMYNADGTRLRGLRASVAELILDQQRSARSAEEVQFFTKEVWQPEAGEAGLPGAPSLVSSTRRGTSGPGMTLMPDMFGHVGPSTTTGPQSASRSVDEMVMQWGQAKRSRSVSGDNESQQAGLSAIPATHRWRRVVSHASRGGGGGAFGWERVDTTWRETTLRASAAAALERNEGDATWRAELRRAAGLEDESSTVTNEDNNTAFFTLTQEEYEAVLPCLAAVDADRAAQQQQPVVLSYAATRKLLCLYERYANMLVVVDRWPYWSEDGSVPLPKKDIQHTKGSERGQGDEAVQTVEQLCEWYSRVSEAVLRLRLRRLQQLLSGAAATNSITTSSGELNADVSSPSPQVSEGSESVDLHPLLALLRRHPFLQTHQGKKSAPAIKAVEEEELAQNEDESGAEKSRRSSRETSVQNATPATTRSGQANTVVRELMTPTRWYDAAWEGRRRARLRAMLMRERSTNVPLQRALEQYNALRARATPLLQRASDIFYADDATDKPFTEGTNHVDEHNDISSGSGMKNDDGDFLLTAATTPAPLPPRSLFRLAASPLDKLGATTSLPTSAKPRLTKVKNDVKEEKKKRGVEDDDEAVAEEGPRKMPKRIGEAESSDKTYRAVQREVREVVPVMCARLTRVAQAGWMLPTPVPVHRPVLLSDEEEESAQDAGEEQLDKDGTTVKEKSRRGVTRLPPSHTAPSTTASSTMAEVSSTYDYAAVQKVNQTAVCNRAFSQIGEAVLLSLPRQAPRLYREVEEELEKYLWEDPYALMEDDAMSQELVEQIRIVYAQNLILQRYLHRNENLCEGLRKLIQDTEEANRTAGE